MARNVNDSRVALVAKTLDRALASPHNIIREVGSAIFTRGECAEDFSVAGVWSAEAVRSVVMAFAIHAPDRFLDDMAKAAKAELEWCEWWDAEGYDASVGKKPVALVAAGAR